MNNLRVIYRYNNRVGVSCTKNSLRHFASIKLRLSLARRTFELQVQLELSSSYLVSLELDLLFSFRVFILSSFFSNN